MTKYKQSTLYYYINKYKLWFVILFFSIMATTFSGSLYPYIFGKLVNEVFTDRRMEALLTIVIMYVCIFVINQILHFALNYSWLKLLSKFVKEIRCDLFLKIQKFPSKYLYERSSGELCHRLNYDSEQILTYIHRNIFNLVQSVLEFAIAEGFIIHFNLYIGIVTALLTPVVVYISRYAGKIYKIYQYEMRTLVSKSESWIYEVVKNLTELKLLNALNAAIEKYLKFNIDGFRVRVNEDKLNVIAEQANNGILLVSKMIIYVFAAFLIRKNQLSIGWMISILAYFDVCIDSFNSINKKIIAIQENKVGMEKVIATLNEETENYNENGLNLVIEQGDIEFQNVSFGYNKDLKILSNISFQVSHGETLAIVGPSGVGKSTILGLINKLLYPDEGNILVDGVNVNEYNLASLRQQIGVVYQESIFFEGRSLRYNLIYEDKEERDSEIMIALKSVDMDEFVEKLPEGLNTKFRRGYFELSGGQKQRLSIARAILKKSKIVLFDEPTASLDMKSEAIFKKALTEMFEQTTKVIVSHKLSTIIDCDKIIVLNNGQICGIGKHEDLINKNYSYRKIFYEQQYLNLERTEGMKYDN